MGYEHRPNSGSVFSNRDKRLDWHPDYRGDICLPNGDVHYLDMSLNKTAGGDVFYKLKIGKLKSSVAAPALASANSKITGDEPIPF